MPARHDNLYGGIARFSALKAAWRKAIRGKRHKPGAAAFTANLERELLTLERSLLDHSYRPGRYVEIEIHQPKHRLVSAAPFRDRVVHHAVYAVVAPIFEQGFITHSYANREDKGTHRAVDQYEHWRDRHRHVLRCDIYRYFPAIDHDILKALLRRRIFCRDTLWLLDTIIDGSNAQEPVNQYYPGDDLFSPFDRRRGLPIGNLTSQFMANVYLDGLDHFVTERLGAAYLRYVDDFALFHDDPSVLAGWRDRIAAWLHGRRLRLHPRKSVIIPTREQTTFLGYDLLPDHRRLPEANVRRFRNRLRGLRDAWRAGSATQDDIQARIQSWIAHAEHAHTWRLRHAIFAGGWFDPALQSGMGQPPAGPGRPTSGGSSAAVPGTTIQGTSAPASATTTTTGTTTSAVALPAPLHARVDGITVPPRAPRVGSGASMMSATDRRTVPFGAMRSAEGHANMRMAGMR